MNPTKDIIYISVICLLLYCWYRSNELAFMRGELAGINYRIKELKEELK